jgi:hypothetical protein
MKPMLPILFAVAKELNKDWSTKVAKMMNTPLTAKELAVSGEEILAFMDVPPGKIIGEVQRAMLAALWAGTVENKRDSLFRFASQLNPR